MRSFFEALHLVHLLAIASLSILVWVRSGFWVPRYIHGLAVAALVAALGLVWATKDFHPSGATLPMWIAVILFPGIVYGGYIVYSGPLHARRDSVQERNSRDK